MRIKALDNLETMINESADLPVLTRERMLDAVKDVKSPLETDKWIYRIVVGALAVVVLVSLILTFLLSINDDPNVKTDIPEIFMAIGSAAVGALAGLLAPRHGRSARD